MCAEVSEENRSLLHAHMNVNRAIDVLAAVYPVHGYTQPDGMCYQNSTIDNVVAGYFMCLLETCLHASFILRYHKLKGDAWRIGMHKNL